MTQKSNNVFIDEIYFKPPKKPIPLTKQTFIILMTFGV